MHRWRRPAPTSMIRYRSGPAPPRAVPRYSQERAGPSRAATGGLARLGGSMTVNTNGLRYAPALVRVAVGAGVAAAAAGVGRRVRPHKRRAARRLGRTRGDLHRPDLGADLATGRRTHRASRHPARPHPRDLLRAATGRRARQPRGGRCRAVRGRPEQGHRRSAARRARHRQRRGVLGDCPHRLHAPVRHDVLQQSDRRPGRSSPVPPYSRPPARADPRRRPSRRRHPSPGAALSGGHRVRAADTTDRGGWQRRPPHRVGVHSGLWVRSRAEDNLRPAHAGRRQPCPDHVCRDQGAVVRAAH